MAQGCRTGPPGCILQAGEPIGHPYTRAGYIPPGTKNLASDRQIVATNNGLAETQNYLMGMGCLFLSPSQNTTCHCACRCRGRGESVLTFLLVSDGLLITNKGERWQVGCAPACYGNSMGTNPDISQKYKMGDIRKGVANTLSPVKKIKKVFECYSSFLNQRQHFLFIQIRIRNLGQEKKYL